MGLDMYLTGRKFFWTMWEKTDLNRREDGKRIKSLDVELGYWRKHPDLHGFIVQTFADGKDDCNEIELNADNIRLIIKAIKAKQLPKTSGFFFGESDNDERQRMIDVAVFEAALDWLADSDPDPFADEPINVPGFTAVVVKPRPAAERKRQNVTRSVHYEASW